MSKRPDSKQVLNSFLFELEKRGNTVTLDASKKEDAELFIKIHDSFFGDTISNSYLTDKIKINRVRSYIGKQIKKNQNESLKPLSAKNGIYVYKIKQ